MAFREKTVLFGDISGGFNLQVADDGQKSEITLCAIEGDSYPIRWTLEGNAVITDEEMEYLRGELTAIYRISDKKVSELIGRFISQKRSVS